MVTYTTIEESVQFAIGLDSRVEFDMGFPFSHNVNFVKLIGGPERVLEILKSVVGRLLPGTFRRVRRNRLNRTYHVGREIDNRTYRVGREIDKISKF